MARYRSRRSNRRTASQSAASLLALALPAPIQRVADTRLGPLLMLVGVPTMIVAGLLNVNWSNGLPSLTVDRQAAANALQKTRERYNNLEQQGGFGQVASDLISGISNTLPADYYSQSYPTAQQTGSTRIPSGNLPSTQPNSQSARDRYTSTQPTSSYNQQPAYPSSTYNQNAPSPSDTRTLTQQQYQQQQQLFQQRLDELKLYQQQIYQQQLYQQKLYQQQQYELQQYGQLQPNTQQQLYNQQQRAATQPLTPEQQHRQWLAQQQAAAQPSAATGYQQQYDANHQGLLPRANTNGRY